MYSFRYNIHLSLISGILNLKGFNNNNIIHKNFIKIMIC